MNNDADRYDVFVSHASEDAESVARPLATLLEQAGLTVWLDTASLSVGDSLRAKIDEGLAGSRFAVVVLSHAFFSKVWTQYELGALFAKSINGGKILLPVSHGLSIDDLVRYSPLLADKLFATTSSGLASVAQALLLAIAQSENVAAAQGSAEFTERMRPKNRLCTGGTLGPDCLYILRDSDNQLARRLRKVSGLLVLTGPRGFGKTSALIRLAAQAKSQGLTSVQVDCLSVGGSETDRFHLLAEEIIHSVSRALESKPPIVTEVKSAGPAEALTYLGSFLHSVTRPVFLALDEADALDSSSGKPLLNALFSLRQQQLREQQGNVIVAIATSPNANWLHELQGPMAELAYHVRLRPFTLGETEQLFILGGVGFSAEILAAVYDWTGGWPLLVQLYAEGLSQKRPPSIIEDEMLDAYCFAHLRYLLESHRKVLMRLLNGRSMPPPSDVRRLEELEIICFDGEKYSFRGRAFEEFFRRGFARERRWWQLR